MNEIVLLESIQQKIYLIRGHKVMLDSDLAELYEVSTKVLVQAVKRNIGRIPVVERSNHSHLIGLITRKSIIEADNHALEKKKKPKFRQKDLRNE